MAVLTPVDYFLRLCLSGQWRPEAWLEARRVSSLPGFAWEPVEQQIARERLGALLYALLKDQALLPAPLLERLHGDYQFTGRRNLFLLHELGKVLRCLQGAGIQIIVLKGISLMETVYQDIAVRPVLDIDLLLPAAQVEQAVALLAGQGYHASHAESHTGIHLDYENEIMLHKPGALNIPLELHWSLLDSPHYQQHLPMGWFQETATQAEIAGVRTKVLGPEALLLHLCAHLVLHHRGDELLWLHDVAAVLQQAAPRVEWEQLLARAEQFDLVLPLRQVLHEVARGWRVDIPEKARGRLESLVPSRTETRLFGWLTAETRPLAQRFLVDLLTIPGRQQRLRYLFLSLFPSAAYMEGHYGVRRPWLLPLYYPYRWLIGFRSIFS